MQKVWGIHPNAIKTKDKYNKVIDMRDKTIDTVNKGIEKVIDTAHKVKDKVSECVGSYYVNGYE